MITEVDDPADARLADFFDLTDRELRRRAEEGGGFFIAEGATVVRRVLESGCQIRAVLVMPSKLAELGDFSDSLPVYLAPPAVLNRVVGFDLHRGAVASVVRPHQLEAADLAGSARRLAVLEGMNDHENLGAIFRSASALGVEAILLDPTCADPWYRRCVRVSMGEVAHVPFSRITPWPDGLAVLRELGFLVVGLTPDPTAPSIERVSRSNRTAVLLGAEGTGLTRQALSRCDLAVRISMRPGPDSLNVGHAAAIAFHRLFGTG